MYMPKRGQRVAADGALVDAVDAAATNLVDARQNTEALFNEANTTFGAFCGHGIAK